MGRSVLQPTSRLLNHSKVFYAPGDRALARELFRAIGCRVLDPQEEEGPPDLGAAAGPYLIIFVDPKSTDLIDNLMYASEVEPAQWQLEQVLRERIAATPEFKGRLELAGPFRSGDPGSVDPRVIQGFIRTDIISSGFLLVGQQIELQARLD